ncbi:MAG: hypothetical protein FWF20_04120 [Betaproteobacteria bacterium]|nr:hypothetical protein [Betaproteobacteria bacterium]MCL2885964.1 hypothetical protein [Betaproteobacteria bacterium]
MKHNLTAPKILPWIAHKAGISEELALKLWRRAIGEAEYLTGKSEGSDYWSLAVERFLAFVEDEAGAAPQDGVSLEPGLSWMWHHQTRMALLSMLVLQNSCRYWQNTLERVRSQCRGAT